MTVKREVSQDAVLSKLSASKTLTDRKYKQALLDIERLQKELGAFERLCNGISFHRISPATPNGDNEAVAVAVASDWHVEETVVAENVSGINEYDLAIAKTRSEHFFQKSVQLTKMFSKDVQINTLVLALLGDFISGNIHEENLETASLPPIEAALYAQELITSGIDFLLKETPYQLIIPCVSGNHSRITAKKRNATESGNSLEYFVYKSIQRKFRRQRRIVMVVPRNQFAFIEIYGKILRFQHGDAIRYQGGVGDIFVPVNRQIPKWNNVRPADFDVFGHFHRRRDGGSFVSNGSLIGYNAFAQKCGFGFEKPMQELFLWDSRHGRSIMAPIFV